MAKVIFSLTDELLKLIDAHCVKFKYNRSEFIRHAVREVFKKENDNTIKSKTTN